MKRKHDQTSATAVDSHGFGVGLYETFYIVLGAVLQIVSNVSWPSGMFHRVPQLVCLGLIPFPHTTLELHDREPYRHSLSTT